MDALPTTDQALPGPENVSLHQHVIRIGILMVVASALMTWGFGHTEASFADGLRYIRQAEQIERGAWRTGLVGSIDHPLHPLAIVAARAVVGGEGPVSWQRAAVALAYGCYVLLVIPVYLVTREVFGDETAWLGCLLVISNPLMDSVVVNALSENTFLLLWTWGLWAAVRFLRDGRFFWLPLTISLGVLAYLSRPEGLLLPLAVVVTMALLPLRRATRINWPRWGAAVAALVFGSLLLAGPYMAMKGGPGTKPAVARVLGLAPVSSWDALERERPLPPDQSTLETYVLATNRMIRAVRGSIPLYLLPFAALGLTMIRPGPARARTWLCFSVIVLVSAIVLVRLHATGGYCTARHGLVPGMFLILCVAHGLTRALAFAWLPGSWLGRTRERLRPGYVAWAVLLLVLVVLPRAREAGHRTAGPFNVYRDTGAWLAQNTRGDDRVLDLTDWSLYFSGRPGYRFAHVYAAPADPKTRWIVVRRPHIDGHWNYSKVVRELVGNREPTVAVPHDPQAGQLQVLIYDRFGPRGKLAATTNPDLEQTTRR
jgi:hypothetical protein